MEEALVYIDAYHCMLRRRAHRNEFELGSKLSARQESRYAGVNAAPPLDRL